MNAATLPLAEAVRRSWDVVVVGAGPGGAFAARELARWGLAVLLVDKCQFPRSKVCGGCLNGRALAILRSSGLGALPKRQDAQPLHHVWLAAPHRQAQLPLLGGAALSRLALDAALADAAVEAGAAFLPGTQARLGSTTSAGRCVLLRQADCVETVTARLVVAADGLGGRLADPMAPSAAPGSWIGAGALAASGPAFYAPGTIYLACGRGGYVGIVRVELGRLDIAAALDPALVKRLGHPGPAAADIVREAGFPALPEPTVSGWRGTPLLTRASARLAQHRLFVVGDAAGYVEPFTGEGMAWALTAAEAVVPLAVRGLSHWTPSLEEEWTQLYRQTVASRQDICRIVVKALRHPALTATVIGLLHRWPALASPLLGRLQLQSGH
jgi:flavin-dependent dehydrogenase